MVDCSLVLTPGDIFYASALEMTGNGRRDEEKVVLDKMR